MSPRVELFVELNAAAIGARFATTDAFDDRLKVLLQEIHLNEVIIHGQRFIELSAVKRSLYRSFFSLVGEIANDVINKAMTPADAITAAVGRWDALLLRQSILSDESQMGLFGEIWLLRRLIGSMGHHALTAWVGPLNQAHDFRVGDNEFEVKTTSSVDRIHRINGAGQLVPSLGCSLHLVSIQVAKAGSGGESLPEAVSSVETSLSEWPKESDRFRSLLDKVGYDFRDEALYDVRRRLRHQPMLIPILDGVPRLTHEAINELDSRYSPHRISHVVYDIDVSGLGYPDDSPEFLQLIPATW
ncbi:PD-(D/E)XK motif protein [Phyllobacterium lublinensis]|uniref:PD-(D/E)XK motif protein n=1 Tax=Phyllobacterium lublinensis TaxID=2875708 RepID=UPI001CD03F86|nr:PD-(D/E)XK motif protein [Phyllobacterium sp. 2063]MBZ9654015.1 PD-(D/E)XK motif protein [Phyllobacterium sp. 2063]